MHYLFLPPRAKLPNAGVPFHSLGVVSQANADQMQGTTEAFQCKWEILTVTVEGVGEVVLQAGNGALALHSCLAGKAHKGNHGQSAVLDLLLLGVFIPQGQGVEGHAVQEP